MPSARISIALCASVFVCGCQAVATSPFGEVSETLSIESAEERQINNLESLATIYSADIKDKRCTSQSGDDYEEAVSDIESRHLGRLSLARIRPDVKKTYLLSVLYWREETAKAALRSGCYRVAYHNCAKVRELAIGQTYSEDRIFATRCMVEAEEKIRET